MFRNRLYYRLKPLLPWSVRIGLRRWLALRKRPRVSDVWPILPGSEKPPAGWPGWPDGKQFAFVLTHDVEGPEGLAKVKPLAELEMSLGFRSCFNFIPEGDYEVPPELRDWLVKNGFEVGVHDLKHDGRLFASRQEFVRSAPRINEHLREWNARGFRAGFMLNQLDWLHDLNVQYDCSTFDTDPFEPQPHGQHTIFPFWVGAPEAHKAESRKQKTEISPNADLGTSSSEFQLSAFSSPLSEPPPSAPPSALDVECSMLNVHPGNSPSSVLRPPSSLAREVSGITSPGNFPLSGYVELPYTLPQDSTLFLLLREQTPEIWLRKLDWVAQHGGMALVNVHPDYVQFPGEPPHARTYPVQHYRDLLEHVRSLSAAPSRACPLRLDRGESDATLAHPMGEGRGVMDSGEESNSPLLPSGLQLSAFNSQLSGAPSSVLRPPSSDAAPISAFQNVSVSAFDSRSSVLRPPSSVFLASGVCWHPLPRQIAAFVAPLRLPLRPKPKRICMLSHSYYSRDNRVIRYAESLTARGDQVDVLSLRPGPDAPRAECLNGVNVFHLQDRFSKHGESATDYLRPILRFFLSASFWITRHQGRRRYDLCHIHNIPDFLVFAAWYPRLRGAKVILDVHDVVPEFFASKFSVSLTSWRIRSLLAMERWSAGFAHHVIIANHLWLEKYVARSARAGKCSVFINNVDSALFHPRPRPRTDDRTIVMFPGGLQWHQGLDIALRAFQKVSAVMPAAEFHIYGDGNVKPQLVALAAELGLNGSVRFFEPVRVQKIAQVMANADLGVVPKRADSFGNEAYSTKIMEFMSLGVPVVVSGTKIDRYYFNDSVVRFFESGNPASLAEAMLDVLRDRPKTRQMVARARAYAVQNSWDSRKADYLKLVDDLCSR